MPEWMVSIFGNISVQKHFDNLARGVVDSRNLIFFLSIVTFALAWAVRSIEARKWK